MRRPVQPPAAAAAAAAAAPACMKVYTFMPAVRDYLTHLATQVRCPGWPGFIFVLHAKCALYLHTHVRTCAVFVMRLRRGALAGRDCTQVA